LTGNYPGILKGTPMAKDLNAKQKAYLDSLEDAAEDAAEKGEDAEEKEEEAIKAEGQGKGKKAAALKEEARIDRMSEASCQAMMELMELDLIERGVPPEKIKAAKARGYNRVMGR
jgi:hypothetical protein